MIAIGVQLSGPELEDSPIDLAIMAAMRAAIEARGDYVEGMVPAVNVVFCVPGSLARPDWDYIQVAKYSAKRKLLLVQVAVSPEAVHSDTALDDVIEALYGANANAFEFYRQKGMDYPLAEAETLVGEIRRIAEQELAQGGA